MDDVRGRRDSEVAKLLRVPQRRVLEWLDAGEIEAERDPRTGRWRIPRGSLDVSETERLTELLTEEQLARLQTTEEALSTLEEHARALRKERDRLREELEAERGPRGSGGGFSVGEGEEPT